jgi:hypothetical protein
VSFSDNLETVDPNDPDVILKIDMTNVFNTTDRGLTLDVLSGRPSHDYVCVITKGQTFPNCETLSNLFGYFKTIRTYHIKLRYFDWDGQVHLVNNKTDGQEGDPLKMLIFNLTIHNLWGRVLEKFQEHTSEKYAHGRESETEGGLKNFLVLWF